jgi:hypothetical protein
VCCDYHYLSSSVRQLSEINANNIALVISIKKCLMNIHVFVIRGLIIMLVSK